MILPWVSARAYQQAVERYQRAEAQVDRLLDHTQVLERVAAGLSERVPVVKEPDPVPLPILKLLRGFHTPIVREAERAGVMQRRADGETWEEIHADMYRRFYGENYQPEEGA